MSALGQKRPFGPTRDVRFAPESDRLLQRREMTPCANTDQSAAQRTQIDGPNRRLTGVRALIEWSLCTSNRRALSCSWDLRGLSLKVAFGCV